ncbi:MAG: hypothetical protein AAB612_00690 [Patescibacteria group bacterium]
MSVSTISTIDKVMFTRYYIRRSMMNQYLITINHIFVLRGQGGLVA